MTLSIENSSTDAERILIPRVIARGTASPENIPIDDGTESILWVLAQPNLQFAGLATYPSPIGFPKFGVVVHDAVDRPTIDLDSVASAFRDWTTICGPLPEVSANLDSTGGSFAVDSLVRSAQQVVDWNEVDAEAREEGFDLPPSLAKHNASRLIERIHSGKGVQPSAVYPTEKREVAVLFQFRSASASILVVCEPDGNVACFSSIAGENERLRAGKLSESVIRFVAGKITDILH